MLIVQLPRLTLVVATTVAPVTALEAVTFAPDTVPVDVILAEPVLIAPDVMVDDVEMAPHEISPDVIVLPPVLIVVEVIAPVVKGPDDVIDPVMFTSPVPVMSKEFRSKLAPNCGEVSLIRSESGVNDLKTPPAPPPSPVTAADEPDMISTPLDDEYVTPLYKTLQEESVSFLIV